MVPDILKEFVAFIFKGSRPMDLKHLTSQKTEILIYTTVNT